MGYFYLCLAQVCKTFWWRPPARDLGLSWGATTRLERVVYLVGGALLAGLMVMSFLNFKFSLAVLNIYAMIFNIHLGLIEPAFEELLFRGYGWHQIHSALVRNHPDFASGLITWLLVSILFGLWHLGYADALIQLPDPKTLQLVPLLGRNVLLSTMDGLIVGLVRWRTGKVFGPFLIHAVLNMLG